MLMVTTEDLKPGTELLPVETEICPSCSNRRSSALESSPLAAGGLLCTEQQAVSVAVGLVPALVLQNPMGTSEACRSHSLKHP